MSSGPRFIHSSKVWLPRPVEEVFPFFADARNLEELTPPFLRFQVLTPPPISMAAGTRIDYRLRLHGIPIRWQSEITAWEPMRMFVDEQRRGPYRAWIHTHRFTAKDGGTLVEDEVRYDVPGGALVYALFVRNDVARIFAYREAKLRARFGAS
ncbi:MAG TPA: SRPBCC family protein [Candidatus Eisenbacteria bacterium]|nr:SRPBCC family protein [Candidatus Eisenbacteria bacterium]